ncbi:MAG: M20 family metallo-hydrolase, partial [Calditrichaeota bacterium]|nr:M20 family metallo-hydrolase [Calditrichota bacterium]
MVDKQIFEKVTNKIEELRPRMIEFQKEITAIPAISPASGGEGEWDKAMYIKKFLEGKGFQDIEQIDAPDPKAKNGKRPNLVLRLPGQSDARTIWIMAHTDVVPEGDRKKWDTDPFEVVEKDGKLFGRGTEDNQQSLTSAIFTAIALKELNLKPQFNLNLILVADEETGSDFGLSYLLKNHREWFRKEDIVLVPDAGLPDATQIEVAEKGIVWLKITTKGKQCHASLPNMGINAFKAASKLVVKLEDLYQIFDVKDTVFEPAISTFEPTKKEANVPNVNTIPGEDVFYFDCRLLPEYKVDELLNEIRRICDEVEKEYDVKIDVEPLQREDAAPA